MMTGNEYLHRTRQGVQEEYRRRRRGKWGKGKGDAGTLLANRSRSSQKVVISLVSSLLTALMIFKIGSL